MVAIEFDLTQCIRVLESLDEEEISEMLSYQNVRDHIRAHQNICLHVASGKLECMKLVMEVLGITFKEIDPTIFLPGVDLRVLIELEKVGFQVLQHFLCCHAITINMITEVEDHYIFDLARILIRLDQSDHLIRMIQKRLTIEDYFELLDYAFEQKSVDCAQILNSSIWNYTVDERHIFRGTDELYSIYLRHISDIVHFMIDSTEPWSWFLFRLRNERPVLSIEV